jgi:membrane protein implicated in regulation of membrane protease activity
MEHFFPFLGYWIWWVAAGILLILELMAPGVFLIWLAAAAAVTGLADMMFSMTWQVELLVFAALSVVSVAAGRVVYRGRSAEPADNEYLNRRQHGYIGRSFTLAEPIANGRGKLTIDDTIWEIEGPDLARGSQVKVISVSGMRLQVAAV